MTISKTSCLTGCDSNRRSMNETAKSLCHMAIRFRWHLLVEAIEAGDFDNE